MPLDLFEEAKYSESIGSIGSHSHNCYEILFVKEGKLELKIDSKSYIVEAPSLIFISKLEMHHINVLSQKYHRYFPNMIIISQVKSQMLTWYQFIIYSPVSDKTQRNFSASKKRYLTFWKSQLMYVSKRIKYPKSLIVSFQANTNQEPL